jgi:hypothetical protein
MGLTLLFYYNYYYYYLFVYLSALMCLSAVLACNLLWHYVVIIDLPVSALCCVCNWPCGC